ncbi:hypothetical protein FKM82_029761 [Ascaphus truei]
MHGATALAGGSHCESCRVGEQLCERRRTSQPSTSLPSTPCCWRGSRERPPENLMQTLRTWRHSRTPTRSLSHPSGSQSLNWNGWSRETDITCLQMNYTTATCATLWPLPGQ